MLRPFQAAAAEGIFELAQLGPPFDREGCEDGQHPRQCCARAEGVGWRNAFVRMMYAIAREPNTNGHGNNEAERKPNADG